MREFTYILAIFVAALLVFPTLIFAASGPGKAGDPMRVEDQIRNDRSGGGDRDNRGNRFDEERKRFDKKLDLLDKRFDRLDRIDKLDRLEAIDRLDRNDTRSASRDERDERRFNRFDKDFDIFNPFFFDDELDPFFFNRRFFFNDFDRFDRD